MNFPLCRTTSAAAPLLAVLAALGLSACGSSSKSSGIVLAPSAGQTTVATPTKPKIPAQIASKPKVSVPTGAPPVALVTKDLIVGTGPAAATGKSVTMNYVGVLYTGGQEFDSSWSTGKPFGPFTLGQGSVIPGWDKGIPGMKVGGRRELIIPPALGYGAAGSPPKIPPHATLVFVVDLLAVQ